MSTALHECRRAPAGTAGSHWGSSPGSSRFSPGIGADGPVVVLAGAVDAGEGLLVQQADQTVAGRPPASWSPWPAGSGPRPSWHMEIDGGHLMLGGGHLVVLGGGRDAQLPQLHVQVLHKGAHPLPDDAEVLVIQLLTLGGGGAEQGARRCRSGPGASGTSPGPPGNTPAQGPRRGSPCWASVLPNSRRMRRAWRVDGLHGAQQGGLFVQRLAGVGDKDGGDAQDGAAGHLLHKGGGGHVPGGVAPGVVGGAQAAGGEGGGVRLAPGSAACPASCSRVLPSTGAVRKESCFSAVMPVRGWNQWV